ncbi:MAG: hypothetical protein V2J12_03375 [Gammaproteobacteria bacterium]|jgi:hypothetical protein|nr:hypothetical protein [Gammaproteobacteria bacterium]
MSFKTLLPFALLGALSGCATLTGEAPAPNNIERSELFRFSAGDRLEDSDLLIVTGGAFDRTEAFEVVRRPDGGSVLTEIITGANDSYKVETRVRFDADGNGISGRGLGNYAGEPVEVIITKTDDVARITAQGDTFFAEHTAPCDECMMDMSPSAIPMFMMTRRYDEAQGGKQTFRWVARALIGDQVLLDGAAKIQKLGDFTFEKDGEPVAVKQYAFVEKLKNEQMGAYFYVAFNLYTTADGKPLAFATGGATVGQRRGFEGITTALPAQIPATDDFF